MEPGPGEEDHGPGVFDLEAALAWPRRRSRRGRLAPMSSWRVDQVEEIEILNRRIGNLELVTGIRHTWTAATSAANRD
jgi:hypothetical protein